MLQASKSNVLHCVCLYIQQTLKFCLVFLRARCFRHSFYNDFSKKTSRDRGAIGHFRDRKSSDRAFQYAIGARSRSVVSAIGDIKFNPVCVRIARSGLRDRDSDRVARSGAPIALRSTCDRWAAKYVCVCMYVCMYVCASGVGLVGTLGLRGTVCVLR